MKGPTVSHRTGCVNIRRVFLVGRYPRTQENHTSNNSGGRSDSTQC
jgi:hypothetical protein